MVDGGEVRRERWWRRWRSFGEVWEKLSEFEMGAWHMSAFGDERVPMVNDATATILLSSRLLFASVYIEVYDVAMLEIVIFEMH
jgi:hypothetical protein